MTLIELMVAMLIGTILIAGAITVYVQSRANYRTADSIARLQENLRFALDTLEPDVRLARFWGLSNQPGTIRIPAALRVSCAGATPEAATNWALNLTVAVEARDDGWDLPCTPASVPRARSDVLVVRHASARLRPPSAGQVQVRSNPAGGDLFDDAVAPDLDDPEENRDVVINAYYVGTSSFYDDGRPALRRLSLVDGGAAGTFEDQEVIPGIENLQVQLGLDTDGNRTVDRYVDGDDPLADPAAGNRVVAVRLWLLVRADESDAGLGFVDANTYLPPDADTAVLGPIAPAPGDPDYPAEFRRLAASKTIMVRN
jgi:type IV pilus assembly protein PilW